LNIRN